MTPIEIFFKENESKIGLDFNVTPPMYYNALDEAFINYFLTFRDKKDSFHFVLDLSYWTRESLAFNYATINPHVILSLLGFHRFIELSLKDLLRRIDPVLAVKFNGSKTSLFQLPHPEIDAAQTNTIEFAETISRLKFAFQHFEPTSEIYQQFLSKYSFLNTPEHVETLETIAIWRNRIMHNGTTLPNLYAFEYLVSQRLIPLASEILIAEEALRGGYTPHYFKTNSGIHLLDEFLKIKFHFSGFKTNDDSEKIAFSLLKLAHLKELGRAAYNNDTAIRINHSFYESGYKDPINRSEIFASTQIENENFYAIKKCICCNAKALVVYRSEFVNILKDGHHNDFISWFKCFNCDYSLKNNVGDPSYFGLPVEPIFPEN